MLRPVPLRCAIMNSGWERWAGILWFSILRHQQILHLIESVKWSIHEVFQSCPELTVGAIIQAALHELDAAKSLTLVMVNPFQVFSDFSVLRNLSPSKASSRSALEYRLCRRPSP
jgi:hypothetical protein